MGEPTRVLQGFITPTGGVTKYIVDNYNAIDKEKVQFDFLTAGENQLDYEETLTAQGARVFYCCKVTHPIRYYKRIKQVVAKNGYRIVYFNISYAAIIPFLAAKAGGARVLVAHAHSTGFENPNPITRAICRIYSMTSKPFITKIATNYFACSDLAAQWVFGKNVLNNEAYKFLPNAIDCQRYIYNPALRQRVRDRLEAGDKLILGHIGTFDHQKNHEFLIEIFGATRKINANCELWLIGEGELLASVKEKVRSLGLSGSVKFLGQRSDVNELMQGMDIFLLPSRFEGFPFVGVEAQAAGLPCIMSDTITRQINITGNVNYLKLSNSPQVWASQIIETAQHWSRNNMLDVLSRMGFDQKTQIDKMQDIYISFMGDGE